MYHTYNTRCDDYATNAKANTAVTLASVLGGIGTLNAVTGGNGLGGILGGGNTCKELAAKDAQIAELRTEVKLRDANIYTDQKLGDVYERLSGRINCVERQLCDQQTYNAANNATLGCVQSQIAQLFSLTKLVVPNTSVCPGWGNVTITPAAATTAA